MSGVQQIGKRGDLLLHLPLGNGNYHSLDTGSLSSERLGSQRQRVRLAKIFSMMLTNT